MSHHETNHQQQYNMMVQGLKPLADKLGLTVDEALAQMDDCCTDCEYRRQAASDQIGEYLIAKR
ncbi:MAG: hypothetical protein V7707_13885 [Motiliproteus sp.]